MHKVDINTAKGIVEKVIKNNLDTLKRGEVPAHSPIFLHSSPGLGKSSIVRQITEEVTKDWNESNKGATRFGFVDVRLAQMEQSDVAGIPYVSHAGEEQEEMKMSVPHWFPSVARVAADKAAKKADPNHVVKYPEYGILFMDELSNAAIGVQHAAYGIILDRMVHGVNLAPGWLIVAAGNLKGDKTGAKGVAPALANRFGIHMEIKADLDSFTTYAVRKGFDKQVIGFLRFKNDALYRFDPSKNDVAFATPRSWEQVSNLLKVGFNSSQLALALGGCVGDATAADFMSFQKYYGKLPNFTDIMDGKTEYTIPEGDMGIKYAVTSSLIAALVENADNAKRVGNLQKIMDQLDDDFLVMIYKTLKGALTDSDAKRKISNILITTKSTYQRISKYTKDVD